MKICAVICEYDPFHNGHKYLIERARELSGCDCVLCLMSGSFTQRGEAAILPKFVRAVHAVRGGADCVLQLPAAFSVAPAEIFARGAIGILKTIPAVKTLAFGSENADGGEIARAAVLADSLRAAEEFKDRLRAGESYKRSLAAAMQARGADGTIVNSPNGILATEYARAIKQSGADIEILPVLRIGGGYADGGLKDDFSSASAIRAHLSDPRIAGSLPGYVLKDLKNTDTAAAAARADAIVRYALNAAKKSDMARIFGCTEGLENKLKSLASLPVESIISEATNRRYTSSRIRRILTANALGLYADDALRYIAEGTYIKPLAVKKERKNELFAELARSPLPCVIKQSSLNGLANAAAQCLKSDARADFVRALTFGEAPEYDFTVKTI